MSVRDFKLYPQLVAFLKDKEALGVMNIYQLDGFLRAIAITAESLLTEWYNLIFNDNEEILIDVSSLAVKTQIEHLFVFHQRELVVRDCSFPFDAVYTQNHEEQQKLEQWARGFMQGYIVQEDYWNRVLSNADDALIDLFDMNLHVISTVADANYAVATGTDPVLLLDIFASLRSRVISWGDMASA